MTAKRPRNLHDKYHAHVYFDDASEETARELCIGAWQHAHVGLGRFHRQPLGPHPRGSCQLSFDANEFDQIIPWLDAHREGLTIFVHPLTGDVLAEHTELASWLGEPAALNLDVFSR